jgi:putative FmdB family regulatory protein
MPIYEYECRDCRRVVSLLVLRPSSSPAPACPRCGGVALTRLLSRFASPKSEDARMEAIADTTNFGDLDENDPASVARFMKRMGREMGDDLGDDFEGALDEAMAESESAGEAPAGAEPSSDMVSSDSAETSES